jgi:hypothetical protein
VHGGTSGIGTTGIQARALGVHVFPNRRQDRGLAGVSIPVAGPAAQTATHQGMAEGGID